MYGSERVMGVGVGSPLSNVSYLDITVYGQWILSVKRNRK